MASRSSTENFWRTEEGVKDELNSIRNSLKNVVKKDDFKTLSNNIVKKSDFKELVSDIVQSIVGEMKEEVRKNTELQIQQKTEKLREDLDKMNNHNYRLQESIREKDKNIKELQEKHEQNVDIITDLRAELYKVRTLAIEGVRKGNYNEQYSRRNNIKIMNMKELNTPEEENKRNLAADFCNLVNRKLQTQLISPGDIQAIHRIPGRDPHKPKPIVAKFWKKDVRNSVIRKKKVLTDTVRLVDDVTKDNVLLVKSLKDNPDVDNAWYFNGKVFAESGGRRKQIDLFDKVSDIFHK